MCEIIDNLALKRAKAEIEETRIKGIVDSVKLLMKNAKMTIDTAFEILEIPMSERDAIQKRI